MYNQTQFALKSFSKLCQWITLDSCYSWDRIFNLVFFDNGTKMSPKRRILLLLVFACISLKMVLVSSYNNVRWAFFNVPKEVNFKTQKAVVDYRDVSTFSNLGSTGPLLDKFGGPLQSFGGPANRPFPNYLWPLFQSKSWCSSFHRKISFHLHVNENPFSYERMSNLTSFEKVAKDNSEVAD